MLSRRSRKVGVVTMMRSFGLACALAGVHLVAATGAMAQTASAVQPVSCPGAPLSIYFAAGDVSTSPQAQELIGRIGETAETCHADRIDLIAHIDAKDGQRAVTVALERLNRVAVDLVAQGLPADRIRIAARAPEVGEMVAGPNQVNVLIRKSGEAAGAAPTTPAAAPMQAISSYSI